MNLCKTFTISFYHVPYFCKYPGNLFFGSCYFGRIGKIIMKPNCFSRKIWAPLFGVVANSNDNIKINLLIFKNIVGCISGNINSIFLHGLYRSGIYAMCFHSCAVNFSLPCRKLFEISMGNLTSAAVAGT